MLPHLRKSRQAQAVTNLLSLGHEPPTALRMLHAWRYSQSCKSGNGARDIIDDFDDNEAVSRKAHSPGLVVSFHYGFYPGIYRALANQSPTGIVVAIIGEQPTAHELQLRTTAAAEGFEIEFVSSGPHMIKDVRRALRASNPAVLLVDVPWSKSGTQLDAMFKTPFGAFASRTALERLITLIDPEPLCLFSNYADGRFTLEGTKWNGLSSAFETLGMLLLQCPYQYERLDTMHHYVRFNRPAKCMVCFEVGQQYYAFDSATEKFWRLSDSQCLRGLLPGGFSIQSSVTQWASRAAGQDIDVVLSI